MHSLSAAHSFRMINVSHASLEAKLIIVADILCLIRIINVHALDKEEA